MPMTPLDIDQVVSCYAGLGEALSGTGAIRYHHCQHWLNSTMSPAFLCRTSHLDSELNKIEELYKRARPRYEYDAKRPYVNLLTLGRAQLPRALVTRLNGAGWKEAWPNRSLNLWTTISPLDLPKDMQLRAGHYDDKGLYKAFSECMVANFKVSPLFMRELDWIHRRIGDRLLITSIWSGTKVAAAALVARGESGALLYCDSVMSRYRGRGLSGALNSARQMLTAPYGVSAWAATTNHPRLLFKGDRTFRYSVFTKS